MKFSRADLANLGYFLAIAKNRSFRLAGLEMGVSTSALSHSLRGLEDRVGVRLVNRTNRSVALTAAGQELYTAIAEPFAKIDGALDVLNHYRKTPAGSIRLNVFDQAATLLLAPVMPTFLDRYPEVDIDLVITNNLVDITEQGFDAGIRYGGTVPEDMIAQRLSAEICWVAAASPAYLERFGTPRKPNDLLKHRCLQIRLGDDRVYRWEFDRKGGTLEIAVPGAITLNDIETARAMALSGAGILYGPEPSLAADIQSGALRRVLKDWSSVGPGMFIYYSSRRQVPVPIRLLVELIQEIQPLGM